MGGLAKAARVADAWPETAGFYAPAAFCVFCNVWRELAVMVRADNSGGMRAMAICADRVGAGADSGGLSGKGRGFLVTQKD